MAEEMEKREMAQCLDAQQSQTSSSHKNTPCLTAIVGLIQLITVMFYCREFY
jgi:hypothetical protein